MEPKPEIHQFCLPGDYMVYPQINLSERFPGYRIIDRNSADYQMEAFVYTCTILLIYTLTTGAFMVKFILQSREPWEDKDGPPTFANAYLTHLAKVRERESHKRLVDRQVRQDVKLRVINHLNQISNYNTITSTTVTDTDRPDGAAGDIRSGSDGMIDVRPILKSYSPNGYLDTQHLTVQPRSTLVQTSGHSLLLPLWVPTRWKQSPSPANSAQSSWRCTPSPQMSACIPRLSARRDSLEVDDTSVMINI